MVISQGTWKLQPTVIEEREMSAELCGGHVASFKWLAKIFVSFQKDGCIQDKRTVILQS